MGIARKIAKLKFVAFDIILGSLVQLARRKCALLAGRLIYDSYVFICHSASFELALIKLIHLVLFICFLFIFRMLYVRTNDGVSEKKLYMRERWLYINCTKLSPH